jgi:hypothetical protein
MPNATNIELHQEGNPEEWAGDELAQFLAAGWRNSVRSFTAQPEHYRTLSEIHNVFRTMVTDPGINADRVSAAFLVQTHGAFLGAASLALSGQVAQAYSLMRTALETVLQAVYIASDPQRQQVWLSRHDDDAAKLRAQSMITMDAMRAHLHALDHTSAEVLDTLYTRAIERAAHPNTYANLSRQLSAESGGVDLREEYFVLDDEIQRSSLRSAAQVGICALTINYYLFSERYRELGLPDRINMLRQRH